MTFDFSIVLLYLQFQEGPMNYENSYNLDNKDKQTEKEIRRIQTIHHSSTFILVLLKDFVTKLKTTKGDYVKCFIENERLVVAKIEV